MHWPIMAPLLEIVPDAPIEYLTPLFSIPNSQFLILDFYSIREMFQRQRKISTGSAVQSSQKDPVLLPSTKLTQSPNLHSSNCILLLHTASLFISLPVSKIPVMLNGWLSPPYPCTPQISIEIIQRWTLHLHRFNISNVSIYLLVEVFIELKSLPRTWSSQYISFYCIRKQD